MTKSRVAQPGDIFILLVPSAQELHRLQQWQSDLQSIYGGHPVNHIHITCQRFSPMAGQPDQFCTAELKSKLHRLQAFNILTDQFIQFRAPYWQTYVLRWRVQETPEFADFRHQLDELLTEIDCPSHFNRDRHASCTALNLSRRVSIDKNLSKNNFPIQLFSAKKLIISQLRANHQFKILENIQLPE